MSEGAARPIFEVRGGSGGAPPINQHGCSQEKRGHDLGSYSAKEETKTGIKTTVAADNTLSGNGDLWFKLWNCPQEAKLIQGS
eukprot:9502565-Pyramimonas_sp.AAC.1